MCLRDEDKWNTRPKYKWVDKKRIPDGEEKVPAFQLRSMAQTRACSKAFRNSLSWIVMMAGYSPTPAEEMTGNEESGGHDSPQSTGGIEREMASKYDNAKCAFCGEKHLMKGDTIVLADKKWGAKACYLKQSEPPAEGPKKDDRPEGIGTAQLNHLHKEFGKADPKLADWWQSLVNTFGDGEYEKLETAKRDNGDPLLTTRDYDAMVRTVTDGTGTVKNKLDFFNGYLKDMVE